MQKKSQALCWLSVEKKSREEVASAIGISTSALAMYENAMRIPRDETKIKIAKYYGRSVQEIFFE